MKKVIILVLAANTVLLRAQTNDFAFLDINNIAARLDNNGRLFNNNSISSGSFEVPAGSGLNTIYAAGMWMGGYRNSRLKLAAQGFSNDDFQQGPVMDALYYSSELGNWQRVWKISKQEINDHIANYTNPSYVIPEAIENWPAHGDVSKGQAQNLAPFADVNNNGVYDPENGDYPKAKGDEAVYAIFNDDKIHGNSGGDRLKIEVHAMLYGFTCSDYSVLNNTVFLDYRIINRSAYTYTDTYFGFWTDFDIGCSNDDFVGCDVQRGMYFGHNGDTTDEACTGSYGYGSYSPAQGVLFLNGPLQDADGLDNPLANNVQTVLEDGGICYPALGTGYGDGIIDNERMNMRSHVYYFRNNVTPTPAQSEPQNPIDFYRYMIPLWLDGSPLYYGGSINGLVPCSYMYPGDSDPLFWNTKGVPAVPVPWDEISDGNSPADRRALASTGSFTFEAGETVNIELAFVFAKGTVPNDNLQPVSVLKQRTDAVRSWYNLNATPCGGNFALGEESPSVITMPEIYPNPASEFIFIDADVKHDALFTLRDVSGRVVMQKMLPEGKNQVDIKNVSNGVYVAELESRNKKQQVKMVIER